LTIELSIVIMTIKLSFIWSRPCKQDPRSTR
jgi:hypothetical protein